jgi:hypothetical protein
MRRMVLRSVAASLATIAALGGVAHAQGAPSKAAAQALFEEGKRLMTAGSLTEACPKFAESQKLDPGAGTLLNLAACYEKNGQTASAWVTYTDAATAAEKSNRKDWAQRATDKAAALQPTLSKLSIVVPGTSQATGLEIKRDGTSIGTSELGVAIPVDPGPHVIEASAPNKRKWTNTVQVGKTKDQVAVTVPPLEDEPGAVAATPTPAGPAVVEPVAPVTSPPAEETRSGSGQRMIGLVVAGVGVVGVGVGSILGLMATSAQSEADKECDPGGVRCTHAGFEKNQDAHSAATISTISFIAGGALLAGGAVLYFTAPKDAPKSAALQRVRIGAAPAPGGGAFTIGGAW